MGISEIMAKMISFSEGNIHDVNHFLKVWAYAKTIGELEQLDSETQLTLEVAAITHDIACPLCRAKYGNTNGKYQEIEGAACAPVFIRYRTFLCSGGTNCLSGRTSSHLYRY